MASDPLEGATPVANDPLAGATPLANDPLKEATPAKPVPSPGIMGYPTPDVQYDIPQEVMNSGLMAYPTQDQRIAMIPTQDVSGRIMSPQEAIDQYHKTGKAMGVFSTPQEANQAIKFWQDESAQTPQARQFAAQQAQMMPSHQPTEAPMPMFAAHQVNPKSALQKTAQFLVGSDKGKGWGDWNPKAMAANIVSNMDNTLANSAGWLAERFKDMQSSLGSSTLNQAVPSLSIMKNVLKSISPKLDSDAIAQRALEHVQNYEQGLAQQAQSWAPQGYQPGLLGKTLGMAGPVALASLNPTAGAALFGTSMGNQAREAAKAGGASPADQKLMEAAGSLGGGIMGVFGTGTGGLGGVAPTLAERAASAATAFNVGGGITAGMNMLEKLLYNPDKNVADGVGENGLMMGIFGAAHASGHPVTEEEATSLARFAKENPVAFAKRYGETLKTGIATINSASPESGNTSGSAEPNAGTTQRTPDVIRQEGLQALRAGDIAKATALQEELAKAMGPKPNVFREATPEEAARLGKFSPLTRNEITPDVEQAFQDALRPKGTPAPWEGIREPVTTSSLKPNLLGESLLNSRGEQVNPAEDITGKMQPNVKKQGDLQQALTEQQDTIESLNQRREQLLSDIQSADEQVQQARRKRGPGGSRFAQKIADGLRGELAEVERRISENTGKTPQELGWENTKNAWNNFKEELKKPGSQRGAIGPNLPREEGTADIPQRLVELANAAAKDGARNASDWVAAMKKQLSDEDFARFYNAVGGVQGAHSIWANQTDITPRQAEIAKNTILSRESAGWKSKAWNESGDITRALRGGKYTAETLPDGGSLKVLHMDSPDGLNGRLLAFNSRNQPVGDLDFSYLDNENPNVFVDEANRRRGIASMLYRLAQEKGGKFPEVGSENAVRSDEGQALRESMAAIGQLHAGLNPFEAMRDAAEAAKKELGLPEGATDADLASEVRSRIGKLGSSVKETVVRIMSKVKGIGREMATALAEHFHKAISGTPEGQLGAIGSDVKPKARDFLTPEQIEAEKADRAKYGDMLRDFVPGDTPEAKAERAKMWKNYQPPWKRELGAKEISAGASAGQEESQTATINKWANSVKAHLSSSDTAAGHAFRVIKGAVDGLNPSGASDDAMKAALGLSHSLGQQASERFRLRAALKAATKATDALPMSDRLDLMDFLEGKRKLVNGDGPAYDNIKALADKNLEMGKKLQENGIIKDYLEDYMRRRWKPSPGRDKYVADLKRSLSGNTSYTNSRVWNMTAREAMEKYGVELVDTNPYRSAIQDLTNKNKMLATQQLLRQYEKDGVATWYPNDKQPNGMVQVNDKLFSETRNLNGKNVAGRYYASPEAARVINNYIDPSIFERNPNVKSAYDMIRITQNAQVAMKLGLSAFHGSFVTNDIMANKLNMSIQRLLQDHDPVGSFKMFLDTLSSPYNAVRGGMKMSDAILGNMTPEESKAWAPLLDMFERSGGDLSIEHENNVNAISKLAQEAGELRAKMGDAGLLATPILHPIDTALATVEAISAPLMKYYIPLAKAGVFADEAAEFLRRNPNATPEERSAAARSIANRIQARMGQVSYDNLNWNKTLKQIAWMSLQATGWKWGSASVALSPQVDLARGAAEGVSRLAPKALDYRMPNPEGLPHPWAGSRVTFPIASLVMGMMASQAIRFVVHAIHPDVPALPQDKKDVLYPRIGGKDSMGRNRRVAVPGYMSRDVPEIWQAEKGLFSGKPDDAYKYITSALNPTPVTAVNLLRGKDELGRNIEGNRLGYLGRQFTPISAQTLVDKRPGYSGISDAARQFIGLPPAKDSLVDTPATTYLLQRRNDRMGSSTPEQSELYREEADLRAKYLNGDTQAVYDAQKQGKITASQRVKIINRARQMKGKTVLENVISDPRTPFDDLYNASKLTDDPKELGILVNRMDAVRRKMNYKLTPDARKAMENQYNEAYGRLKGNK